MGKRLITVMIEVDDNDYAEQKFYTWASDNLSPKYMSTTLNTDHLKDDSKYKNLIKERKKISIQIQDYIINNKKKTE